MRSITSRPAAKVVAVVRILVGSFYVTAGLPKLTGHAAWAAHFQHWHVPLPGLAVYVVGSFEVIGGVLLALGVASRTLAVLFAIDMSGALLFAGVTDGGQYILRPAVILIPLALFALRGAGAWQLRPNPAWLTLRRASYHSGS